MLKVGDTVAGHEIVAKLQSGGMATLFLGRKQGAGGFAKHVAIKVVHSHLAEDDSFVEMFLDEARLSARIDHPNVVQVYDLGEHEGNYYMVMEFIAGCSLAQLLRALAKKKLKLAPEVAVSFAIKLASALHAAHELTDSQGHNLGVVHRDVSPQNVLLAFRGHVKLIDFGIAKASDRAQQTQGSVFKGKIRYAAPEQAMGKALDRRADVYAVGIILWEMLTTHRLFDGESDFEILEQVRNPNIRAPGMVVSGISSAIDHVVLKTLSTNADDRPQTADELRQMLSQACPQALAVDAPHVADLLSVLMQEFVEAETRKLGSLSSISQILGAPGVSVNAAAVAERLVGPIHKPEVEQDRDSDLPTSFPRGNTSGTSGSRHSAVQTSTQAIASGGTLGGMGNGGARRAAGGAAAVALDVNTAPLATESSKIQTSSRTEAKIEDELNPVASALLTGAILRSDPPRHSSPHLIANEPLPGVQVRNWAAIGLGGVAAIAIGLVAWLLSREPGVTTNAHPMETTQPVSPVVTPVVAPLAPTAPAEPVHPAEPTLSTSPAASDEHGHGHRRQPRVTRSPTLPTTSAGRTQVTGREGRRQSIVQGSDDNF